ncbi:MAG: hypothetical protein JRN26_03750 [Nitrososphaerota archaeon]|jgi:hypothetical protein|nr:hypothetical protein [Nitrososphaerota archaeon]MDG6927629.1 hypothetical protein [Nitrososphaerota archaeon]MDG6929952.1 hypothetical protein [Nitrososphaerota archaeon]MDG6931598.1 hypothetical protein [Nitrososphaerota archaeon]MDG6935985.1 hypothetical protein [Nitrososphaerota archaeon]
MSCVICGFYANSGKLCFKHAAAAKNLVENYNVWKNAFNISFEEYLHSIIKNRDTGVWAADVARYIIESGDDSILQEQL